ncbi:MAG: alpha/beta fold hydrolase [Burkholderiales bacterium]|nr:MAG: alpha/beta fold hydrolase [Burkholderiales bacterium]
MKDTSSTATATEAGTSRFVDVDGYRIHYHEAGSGAPVVLIHGGGPGATGWSNYSRNIGPLSERFRVIVPDLPGFGKSDMKPREQNTWEWYGPMIGRFLDVLGIEQAHFVGNSLGGATALVLALERPDKVARMVLMGTAGGMPAFSIAPTDGIKTLLYFYDGEGPSKARLKGFVEQLVFDPSQVTDALLEQRMAAAMRPEIVDNPPMRPVPGKPRFEIWRDARLASLPHDVMFIWGREDRVMPIDGVFVLLKQIPKARLYVLPRCGHWAQWEHADEFNRVSTGFLAA